MDKIPKEVMPLNDAVEHAMRVMGWTREVAEQVLLEALKSGELTAYHDVDESAKIH